MSDNKVLLRTEDGKKVYILSGSDKKELILVDETIRPPKVDHFDLVPPGKMDNIDARIDDLDAQNASLTREVDTHLAEIVSQSIKVTRDASVLGVQQIVTSKKAKIIFIRANIAGTKMFSMGVFTPTRQSSTYSDGTSANWFEYGMAIAIQPSGGNYVEGEIQNITETGFEILWSKVGSGVAGTIQIAMDLLYHGE